MPTGYPVADFHLAAAQHRRFGAVFPSSGLVTNAPSPLDRSRNAFSSCPSPIAEGRLINHVCASLLSEEGERSNRESC